MFSSACFCAFLCILLSVSAAFAQSGPSATSADSSTQQVFQVKGVIKTIQPDGKTVEIRHEAITNYMPAMTMPFEAKEPKELAGLKAGDVVSFRLTATDKDSWIDQIQKLSSTSSNEPPATGNFRLVRDVEPLQVGDPLPDYHFTNELGQAISTSQFKGQALAITFIFTRCPLPNFCPRMSSNFSEVQRKLLAMHSFTNWHLFTISFDPEFDTPPILKAYAERFGAKPDHWNFLTGALIDIDAIAEQFGEMFWREQGALNHNLRTVVVDASGRVQRVFTGNTWTSDELVEEMAKTARR